MSSRENDLKSWLLSVHNISPHLPEAITIQSLLDQGGQGIVYRGLVDNTPAAIKVYFPGQLDKRITREINALEKLDCYSIVKLLWSDQISLQGFELQIVATSLIEGESLDKIISQKALNHDELAILCYDVTTAIDQMWQQQIVHRDLKPSNILIRTNGRACVIDLGLARHLGYSSLTIAGATWGTRGYLSPEQARMTRQLTFRSDLFALGVILAESAMGRHPSRGDQQRLQAMNLSENLPDEVSGWEFASLLQDLLAPRATKRPKPSIILNRLAHYAPTQSLME